jgi:hypothetical protein
MLLCPIRKSINDKFEIFVGIDINLLFSIFNFDKFTNSQIEFGKSKNQFFDKFKVFSNVKFSKLLGMYSK